MADDSDEFAPGKNIGPFKIVRELGRGGMGRVYLAEDPLVGNRLVAVKLILEGNGLPGSEACLRFDLEIKNLARLNHPSIVKILTAGRHNGHKYFVMDYVEGRDLDRYLKDLISLSDLERIRLISVMVAKVARAVAYAHENGVVHRDLKLTNIIVANHSDEPIILDFGIAKSMADTGLTQVYGTPGTPLYTAPEQIDPPGTIEEPLLDVWALGIVLYRAVCGKFPFNGTQMPVLYFQIASSKPEYPTSINKSISYELERIILGCLEKDPRRRIPSALALADRLDSEFGSPPYFAQDRTVHGLREAMNRFRGRTAFVRLNTLASRCRLGVVHALQRAVEVAWPARAQSIEPPNRLSDSSDGFNGFDPGSAPLPESLSRRILRASICIGLSLPIILGAIIVIAIQINNSAFASHYVFGLSAAAIAVVILIPIYVAWRRRAVWAIISITTISLSLTVLMFFLTTYISARRFGSPYLDNPFVEWIVPLILFVIFGIPLFFSLVLVFLEHDLESGAIRALFGPLFGARPVWLRWIRRSFLLLTSLCILAGVANYLIVKNYPPKPLSDEENKFVAESWIVDEDRTEGKSWFTFGGFDRSDKDIVWTFGRDRRLQYGFLNESRTMFRPSSGEMFGPQGPEECRWRLDVATVPGEAELVLESLVESRPIARYRVIHSTAESGRIELSGVGDQSVFSLRKVHRVEFANSAYRRGE